MDARLTFLVGNRVFQNNRVFSKEMRDQANAYFIALKELLQKSGLILATEDIHPAETAALVIDMNVQKWTTSARPGPIRYLLITEPPVVCAANWSPAEHLRYDKVFTWNDSLIDNRKYFLLRYAHNLGMETGLPGFADRKLASMIIGFKASSNAQEQYSARFDTIRWFLRHHPEEFHLYGAGWPSRFRPPVHPLAERFLSGPLDLLLSPFYPKNVCYMGRVTDKVQTSKNYRFAFCYENTHSAPGYITEKIFDAFRAGCVPIYLGPPNTLENISPDCFIDRRHFGSHEELYAYLERIPEREFVQYQERIRAYLVSTQARQFTPSHFALVLRNHILADLGKAVPPNPHKSGAGEDR